LADAYQRIPLLRPGLIASLVTAVVGFLLNDSGVVIPAIMMLIVVPVAVVAASDRPPEVTSEIGCPARPRASKVVP
jgi:hypothetical protein